MAKSPTKPIAVSRESPSLKEFRKSNMVRLQRIKTHPASLRRAATSLRPS
jgi:hypothetical protein